MDQDSAGRCTSGRAAVSAQQPWRRFIKRLILPKQSSSRESWQELSEKWESEGESNSNSSSSEDTCSIHHDVPFRVNERLTCIGCNKRRPSFSDTESVLDIVKMPVGTTNSVLKSSFSLTSLRSSTPTDSPEHGAPLRLNAERPYHSLTKKSRQSNGHDKEQWRKSWGSGISQDGKEFWEGFQADYDYLMAQSILDRDVPDMGTENGIPRAPPVWSHSEFMDNFAQLYSWLKGIQDSVYGKEENVTDWKLRAERLEDMQRQRFRLENFKEESRKLVERWPESEAEVLWRVKHIGEKWESVETMMRGCSRKCDGEQGSREKVEHEIRCLRNWLRELENKLKPLSFQRGWTKAELEVKMKEHMVLHRDIDAHGKILSSVLKLSEKVESTRILTAARALERKYHLNYLRSLEWQLHIKSLIGQLNKGSSNDESDGEPVPKVARFACTQSPEDRYESSEGRSECEGVKSSEELSKDDDCRMDTSVEGKLPHAPTDAMVGPQAQRPNGAKGHRGSTLGTESKNAADASLSCANRDTDSTTNSTGNINNGGREPRVVSTPIEPQINRPKEKPPNTGTFALKHPDTDSDQEKTMQKEVPKGKEWLLGQDIDTTSSEGGWTYKSSNGTGKSEAGTEQKPKAAVRLDFKEEEPKQMKHFSAKNIPPMSSQEKISSSILVEYADELFRCKSGKPRKNRRGRTRKRKELDSCDASGENTDEESRIRYRWRGSAEGISEGKKWHRQVVRQRPLSMSNVSWLRTPRDHNWRSRAYMSESALNQMEHSPIGKCNRTITGEDGSSGSNRKKKSKIRKLTSKKSESASDGLTLSGSDSSNAFSGQQIATLVESGSFSGVSRRQREEHVTESETEEEKQRLMVPVFRLGPSAGAVTVVAGQDKGHVEEQHSLNWDSYQEKYQSEVFSEEPLDSDTAKRVLEFGEDYGEFWDKQSDSASTKNFSFTEWGRWKIDSDSDVNDVRQTLRQSLEQLELWEMKFNKTIGGLLPGSDVTDNCVCRTFLDEIIGACKRNVECLTKLLVEVKDETYLAKEHEDILTSDAMTSVLSAEPEHLSAANMVSVQVQTDHVKDSWENLKSTAELHKAEQLQMEMAVLRNELLCLGTRVDAMETTVTSREELEEKITQVQNELNLMKKGKNRLLQANVSVHRFLASARHADPALKDEVTELYQLWDQTFCRVSSHLSNLQGMSQTWHDFEDHLAQLQCALRTDTLKVLDFALKCGTPSSGVSLSLQDIAGILSDRGSESKDSLTVAEASAKPTTPILAALSTEGSLSDSGISDSGSEQELSEREKRLAQLKRLAKRLETILAPGSQALSNMFKRIEQAESELRELQKNCRDLIVRSASSEEIRMIVANTPTLGDLDVDKGLFTPKQSEKPTTNSAPVQSEDAGKDAACFAGGEPTECDTGKPGKKFWLWRILCYSLPFQLALVALLCLSGMLEPRCCDSLNNFELSLHPQLRYDSGPPPV